jgi:acetyl-CoA carboxylase carboxyl transferase subunit alpha
MGITADKLLSLGLIDRIVEEPLGGAHRDLPKMLETLRGVIGEELANLQKQAIAPLLAQRYERLMAIGRPS